jgi:hypothetical protein
VGEKGRELSIPLTPSLIIPHDLSESLAGDGAGGMTVHLTVPAAAKAQKPSDVVRELRIAARDGSLSPVRR